MKPMRIQAVLDAARSRHNLVLWALAATALLGAHDAVWFVQLGPGEALATAMRGAGHDLWGIISTTILVGAGIAALGVGVRLWMLGRRARTLGAVAISPSGSYVRRVGSAWPRIAVIVIVAFSLQENAEHFIAHGHVLGTGALVGPEYPLAIPVIGVITLIAAAIAAAVGTIESGLLGGIAAALRSIAVRAPRRIGRPVAAVAGRRLPAMAGTDAGRAPPLAPVPA